MTTTGTRTLRTLMSGLIDYAGLFPPAKLDMQPAVEHYARYTRSEHAEFLGRFICPASRLAELSERAAALMPGTFATSGYTEMAGDLPPWPISVIIDGPLDRSLDHIDVFNAHHATDANGHAQADAIEMRVAAPGDIDDALDEIPEDLWPAFEVPADAVFGGDPRGFIAALAGNDAAAKLRCGGVTADAFPAPADVARFVVACAQADVPFKATAGLHHPLRAEHRLTYDPTPPVGTMHGFLNVFVAAALVREDRIDEQLAIEILEDRSIESFVLDDDVCGWRSHTVDLIQLSRVRETFALGYGSCSFTEPVDDLKSLGLL